MCGIPILNQIILALFVPLHNFVWDSSEVRTFYFGWQPFNVTSDVTSVSSILIFVLLQPPPNILLTYHLSLTIVSLYVQLEACTFHKVHITEEQNSGQNPHDVREWYAQHWQGVLKIIK